MRPIVRRWFCFCCEGGQVAPRCGGAGRTAGAPALRESERGLARRKKGPVGFSRGQGWFGVDAQATGRCHSHMQMWGFAEIEQCTGLLLVWAKPQFGVAPNQRMRVWCSIHSATHSKGDSSGHYVRIVCAGRSVTHAESGSANHRVRIVCVTYCATHSETRARRMVLRVIM